MEIDDQQFETFVNEAWEAIPAKFQGEIENVSIVIEKQPTEQQLRQIKITGILLGLFQGTPKTFPGEVILPGKITLYQQNIMEVCGDQQQLKNRIKEVLMHEIGHYFGFNEDQMSILDRKLRKRLSNG